MRTYLIVGVAGLLSLGGCVTGPLPQTPEIAVNVVPQGLTLWMTEQVPQVGDVLRVRPSAVKGNAATATLFSGSLRSRIHPVSGTGYNQRATITGNSGVSATLKLLQGLAPGFSADFSKARSISLVTEGSTTLTLPDRTTVLTAIQVADAGPKNGADEANFFASLGSQDVRLDDKEFPDGAYYIVESVTIAKTLKYDASASMNANAAASCDVAKQTCGSLKLENKASSKGGVTAEGAPVFIRLKRIGRDGTKGVIRYLDSRQGPPAITGS